jgi:hypothetical protein
MVPESSSSGGSPVEGLFIQFSAALEALRERGDLSLVSSADDTFRKSLLLTAASWFEYLITETITRTAAEASTNCVPIVNFLRNKGVHRQFHTYFDWESKNGAKFFGLFGPAFAREMKDLAEADPGYRAALEAFLEIGGERNRMVHENFGVYNLDKTTLEVFELYRIAAAFPTRFATELRKHANLP